MQVGKGLFCGLAIGKRPGPCYSFGSTMTHRVYVGLVGALALAATGCGRRATPADCDLIFNRYVEVQLKAVHVTDPVEVTKREQSMRAEMKDDLRQCPGKRITDSMLRCVQNAQTNDEIDKCTRF
jgi:hypothetical protein